jgi:hypothetical protein
MDYILHISPLVRLVQRHFCTTYNMSQIRQQPLAQEFEATARKQVGEVVRVSEDAVSSGAFLYPLRVSGAVYHVAKRQ